MTDQPAPRLVAISAAAPAVAAAERERLRPRIDDAAERLDALALSTCHRVELIRVVRHEGDEPAAPGGPLPAGTAVHVGTDAARHVLSLAVGLESAVLAEDQLLHQFREAVSRARGRSHLAPELETLLEVALRAGRTARSWRPRRRTSLADVVLEKATALGVDLPDSTVLVIGAGEMGRLVARAARARGGRVLLASRDPDRAATVAAEVGAAPVPFDPVASVGDAALVVVALAGPWAIGGETRRALEDGPVVVDLSQPGALPPDFCPRHVLRIDDLALTNGGRGGESTAFRRRLEGLREARLSDYLEWISHRSAAAAATSLARHIERERSEALAALRRRRPDLDPDAQAEIEALTHHLADRLFREPFERLGRDADGTRERAARELFGL
jgi:glutamyl-tRNA reductase